MMGIIDFFVIFIWHSRVGFIGHSVHIVVLKDRCSTTFAGFQIIFLAKHQFRSDAVFIESIESTKISKLC